MRALVVVLLALAIAPAVQAESPSCCEAWVRSPMGGATNVAPDAQIRYVASNCDPLMVPWLEGPGGKVVEVDIAYDADSSERAFIARPRESLGGGTWQVFLKVGRCGWRTEEMVSSSFEVGGVPKLLGVNFYTGNGENRDCVDVMELQLSEPTAEDPLPYVETSLPATTGAHGSTSGEVYWGYKHLPVEERPKASEPVTVRVRKELPFASGARMAEDVEITLTPSPPRQGCSTAGGMAAPGLLGLLALRRKRKGAGGWTVPRG